MKIYFKAKGGATNADFIGSIHTAMSLCFRWNVFKYAFVFLLERIHSALLTMIMCFYQNAFNIHVV